MLLPCVREATHLCLQGCCASPILLNLPDPANPNSKPRSSTSAACRRDFVVSTASTFFKNIHFTNHESLPSLEDAYMEFTQAYPKYSKTNQVDQIRAAEYDHLAVSNQVCLDYIGIGLFSFYQIQNQNSLASELASSSSPVPRSSPFSVSSDIPFFHVSHKSASLKTQLLHGGHESYLESAMKKRIMDYLNISENDYSMVFTANRTSAFKLVAESYPFQSSRKLLTAYDYESEAVDAMISTSEKRGAKTMSAEFVWPRLKLHSAKLKKMVLTKKKKKNKRGLFVFPLQSRMTGARYPYIWMSIAQENGWHVLLDACALGAKDMDCFGLSLYQPDFLICAFYKIFGDNPSGFGCLFVKKSTISVLETSTSAGIVNLIHASKMYRLPTNSSGTDAELEQRSTLVIQEEEYDTSSSFSGPMSLQPTKSGKFERRESSDVQKAEANGKQKIDLLGLEASDTLVPEKNMKTSQNGDLQIECRGLDQVDSLGLIMISSRARYLINWLVNALLKLQHPNTEDKMSLIQIYGPKIKFERAPALAFNIYDWKGEKVDPVLIQKLADRSNISLSYGVLNHIWFPDKYQEIKEKVLENGINEGKTVAGNKRKEKNIPGIAAVTAALGFLTNFEDTYRLWAFVAQFLDADFVEKERWRYTALNQKTYERKLLVVWQKPIAFKRNDLSVQEM